MSFTNLMEIATLNHIFGGGDYARAAQLEIGLSTTEPQEDGTGITEPAGADGYARVEVDNDTDTWQDAATAAEGAYEGKGVKKNAIDIEFPEATGDWGTVTHFFIADEDTGNIMGYGELYIAKQIDTGDVARFREGELVITLD